jgi:hypothetical protein
MSNTWLNIRFGSRHLQVVYLRSWLHLIRTGRSPITLRRNPYHDTARLTEPNWRWFEVMEARWPW